MLDSQDRSDVEKTIEVLQRTVSNLNTEITYLQKLLNRSPEVKNPVGANIDVTLKRENEPEHKLMGGFFDKRI